MPLSYRLLEAGDVQGIQQLWAEDTAWGNLNEWQHKWFATNPCDGSLTIVAVDDDGEVAGELVYMAYKISVKGREYRALRPIAPIVAKKWRSLNYSSLREHPSIRMYAFGRQVARERGDGLIFGLPNPRWAAFLKRLPRIQCGSFPLFSVPLPLAEPFVLPAGYSALPLQIDDERIDALWDKTKLLHGCSAVRNSQTLGWKLSIKPYILTGIECEGDLCALVVSLPQEKQWLICDVLSADLDNSLRAALMASCNLAHSELQAAAPDTGFKKAAIMSTEGLRPVIEELHFKRDEYDFLFMTEPLQPELTREDVAPERWYSSAND